MDNFGDIPVKNRPVQNPCTTLRSQGVPYRVVIGTKKAVTVGERAAAFSTKIGHCGALVRHHFGPGGPNPENFTVSL